MSGTAALAAGLTVWWIARHVLFLAVLAGAAWAAGRALAGGFGFAGRLERAVVSAALGLAALGHLAFVLGLLGWLAPGPLVAGWAVLVLPGLPRARRWWRERPRFAGAAGGATAWAPRPARRAGPIAALACAAAAPIVLLALYPPTAFDATTYHLPTAAAFAASGRLPFLADLRSPVFPPLTELLAAVGLLFADDVAANLVQLLAAALAAGLLLAWGRQGLRPGAGTLAAAVFLGSPLVVHLATSAYVEMTLTLFATATLYAVWRWRAGAGDGWLALAAVFAGSAAAVKYLGLYFVAAVALAALRGAPRGRRVRATLLAAAVALATLLPAYGRIAALTGNPVFPFLPRLFGASAWNRPSPEPDDTALSAGAAPGEIARRWARLPLLPWSLVVGSSRTNDQPPVSPVYLLGLPVLLWGVLREPRVRRLMLPAAAYVALFPLLPQDARYLAPVLPVVGLALAEAALRLLRPRLAVTLVALACFLPGCLYAGWRVHRQGPLPVTAEDRDRYLTSALPGFSALAHLNRHHGPGYTLYALHAENLAYYAHGRFLGDWSGPAAFAEVLPLVGRPAELHAWLRALGADHLLLVPGKDYGFAAHPAFGRLFREVYADRQARVFAVVPTAVTLRAIPHRGHGSARARREGARAPAARLPAAGARRAPPARPRRRSGAPP